MEGEKPTSLRADGTTYQPLSLEPLAWRAGKRGSLLSLPSPPPLESAKEPRLRAQHLPPTAAILQARGPPSPAAVPFFVWPGAAGGGGEGAPHSLLLQASLLLLLLLAWKKTTRLCKANNNKQAGRVEASRGLGGGFVHLPPPPSVFPPSLPQPRQLRGASGASLPLPLQGCNHCNQPRSLPRLLPLIRSRPSGTREAADTGGLGSRLALSPSRPVLGPWQVSGY